MKATLDGGSLVPIKNCYIIIPNYATITLNALPDINDSKTATYIDEPIPGRASPIKNYSYSDNRTISMTIHFYAVSSNDLTINLNNFRALQSAEYPRTDQGTGAPFVPPVVCKLKCGKLFSDNEICAILRSCSVRWPTEVVWDDTDLIPYKFDVETNWEVVYLSTELPGQDRILSLGN